MTVKDLISALAGMPPEAVVVVKGYEQGVDDMVEIVSCRIHRDAHREWYNGKHEIDPDGKEAAVLITGPKREAH